VCVCVCVQDRLTTTCMALANIIVHPRLFSKANMFKLVVYF
jgi:hypothetical protein